MPLESSSFKVNCFCVYDVLLKIFLKVNRRCVFCVKNLKFAELQAKLTP